MHHRVSPSASRIVITFLSALITADIIYCMQKRCTLAVSLPFVGATYAYRYTYEHVLLH